MEDSDEVELTGYRVDGGGELDWSKWFSVLAVFWSCM